MSKKPELFSRKFGVETIDVGVRKIVMSPVSENDQGGGAGAIGSAVFVVSKPGLRYEIECPIYAGHDNVLTGDAYNSDGLVAWLAEKPMSIDDAKLAQANALFDFIDESCVIAKKDPASYEIREILTKLLRRQPAIQRTLDAANKQARKVERREEREAAREARTGW